MARSVDSKNQGQPGEVFNSPSTLVAGLRCRCPRCGVGKLFAGLLTVAKSCGNCGLDFGFADPADGPAFFAMTVIGILVMGVWAWSTVSFQPPLWLQFTIFIPALVVGCVGALRPIKAWLVAEQYVRHAGEGLWKSVGRHGEGGFAYDRRAAANAEASDLGTRREPPISHPGKGPTP